MSEKLNYCVKPKIVPDRKVINSLVDIAGNPLNHDINKRCEIKTVQTVKKAGILATLILVANLLVGCTNQGNTTPDGQQILFVNVHNVPTVTEVVKLDQDKGTCMIDLLNPGSELLNYKTSSRGGFTYLLTSKENTIRLLFKGEQEEITSVYHSNSQTKKHSSVKITCEDSGFLGGVMTRFQVNDYQDDVVGKVKNKENRAIGSKIPPLLGYTQLMRINSNTSLVSKNTSSGEIWVS